MSDPPGEERDPRPANARKRAESAGAGTPAGGVAEAREPGRPTARGPGRTREPGRPAARAEATQRASGRRRIGIRELRQHASVYVDLAERGYTVDITNRGRLVAQLIPVREPDSPLERLITAGIVEPAEEGGGVGDLEPYPAPAARRAGASATGARPASASATGVRPASASAMVYRQASAGEARGPAGREDRP